MFHIVVENASIGQKLIVHASSGNRGEEIKTGYRNLISHNKIVGFLKSIQGIMLHAHDHFRRNRNTMFSHPAKQFVVISGKVECFSEGIYAVLINRFNAER